MAFRKLTTGLVLLWEPPDSMEAEGSGQTPIQAGVMQRLCPQLVTPVGFY